MQASAARVALVTGAGRGIGAAIARALAARGAALLLAGRSEEPLAELAGELEGAGGRAAPLRLDVADPASVAAALAEAPRLAGLLGGKDGVHWLVNNAGIAESAPLTARAASDEDPYERHMAVNFHGARRLIEGCLPQWKARRYGRVVNVASSAGLRGYPYVAAYCASKFALVGYTLAAAEELRGSGITVNAVCPHYVDSPMLAAAIARLVEKTGRDPAEAREFFRSENPGGELVTPEEVARTVADLLAGDATAQLVELDGGPLPRVHRPNQGMR